MQSLSTTRNGSPLTLAMLLTEFGVPLALFERDDFTLDLNTPVAEFNSDTQVNIARTQLQKHLGGHVSGLRLSLTSGGWKIGTDEIFPREPLPIVLITWQPHPIKMEGSEFEVNVYASTTAVRAMNGVGREVAATIFASFGAPPELIRQRVQPIAVDTRVQVIPLELDKLLNHPCAPVDPPKGAAKVTQVVLTTSPGLPLWRVICREGSSGDYSYRTIRELSHGQLLTQVILAEYISPLPFDEQFPYAGTYVGTHPCLLIAYDPSQF